MRVSTSEPISPRYIHINPVTNKVHLLVPVVGGQEISTDNTCKATVALREFFDGGALRELTAYKQALMLDIALLESDEAGRESKNARLVQIEAYIKAVSSMRGNFNNAMTSFLQQPSNLYSFQLRPRIQDNFSRVMNPVFNVNRSNDGNGTPLSALYNAMYATFPTTVVAASDPQSRLTTLVLNALPESASFAEIQQALSEQSLALFGLTIDFTQRTDGTPATKEDIDALMGFGADVTREDYIDALLGACALDVWETLPTPPFYSIPAATPVDERTERLSILTQFFLANLNIYCKSRSLTTQNFGMILDNSTDLSHDLASLVSTALARDEDVERAVCYFFNAHANTFNLSRALNAEDLVAIRQTFARTYRTVTATNENPHMDDFMILDKEVAGETAKFVTHQGSICVNLAEIIDPTVVSSRSDYFASIRADFAAHPAEVPHRNESVAGEIELDIETLFTRISEEQFERLPQATKEACRAHPTFAAQQLLRQFLNHVARGKQDEAQGLLEQEQANLQSLLRTPGFFTDYSGRTFNCTAYEYAYWAKDTHMCRMLEAHMDNETKTLMLAAINANDTTGLTYWQNNEEHCSAHFDLTPCKTALQAFLNACSAQGDVDSAEKNAAWLQLGKAQCDVPAHVAQEYCRPGVHSSFHPCPEFNEPRLIRTLGFHNWTDRRSNNWFPLPLSNDGLGIRFAIVRRDRWGATGGQSNGREWTDWVISKNLSADLTAIIRLDEVRTADLTLSRANLNPEAFTPLSRI